MGCCQTKDSFEMQFAVTPREQNQLTFGNNKKLETQNSIKSNFMSNRLNVSLKNGNFTKNNLYFLEIEKPTSLFNKSNTANVSVTNSKFGSPMILSAFSLKDEVGDEDTTSNLQFETKSKIISSSKTSNNESEFDKNSINGKNALIENITGRKSKFTENGIKHKKDEKIINSEFIEENKNEGGENVKKNKLFDRIDKLNKSNDEDNNINAIKANENANEKKLNFSKLNATRYRPIKNSNEIMSLSQKLGEQLFGLSKLENNEFYQTDAMTQIMMDKPIQKKNKSSTAPSKFNL